MATVYRTTLIPAVAVLRPVDMGAEELFFGQRTYFDTQEVEFDAATLDGTTASYNSFANTANVVKKDGFDTITLNPLNINESINITADNQRNRGVGATKYMPEGSGNQALRTELEGFGKLKARADRARKKAMYEAMLTGKIQYGQNGIAEIDFNMPAGNIEVETGTDLWTDAGSDPITKLISVYDGMDVTPEAVIMSQAALTAFNNHADVRYHSDSDGKPADVIKYTGDIKAGAKFIKVGRLVDRPLDIYLEIDTYFKSDGTTRTDYLAAGFCVFGGSESGQMLFGGVPMLSGDNITWEATEFIPSVDTQNNPVKIDRIFRSSPLPTLKNSKGFYSLKVTA